MRDTALNRDAKAAREKAPWRTIREWRELAEQTSVWSQKVLYQRAADQIEQLQQRC